MRRTRSPSAQRHDLKSRGTRGHSGRVAELAEQAGRRCGVPDADLVLLRRAGLVHDLGRVGVAAGVWDIPGQLGVAHREKARLHPYLTERVLSRCPALRPLVALAGAHNERIDGSEYQGGNPVHIGLHHHREQRLIDAVATLQQ